MLQHMYIIIYMYNVCRPNIQKDIHGQTSEWTSTLYGYRQLHTVRHMPCLTCTELIKLIHGHGFCCSGFCILEHELFFKKFPVLALHVHIFTQ